MKKPIVIITASLLTVLASVSTMAQADASMKYRYFHSGGQQLKAKSQTSPIDINTADVGTLCELKGIGPKKAQAIVSYREQHGNYKSLEDLALVKGISKKLVARLISENPNRMIVNG